jgi:predicted Abi (CAAX) family protease
MALRQSIELLAESNEDLSPEGIISGGVFGACCGVLAWRTGSILTRIILPAIYNILIFGKVFLIYQLELRVPW